MYYSTDSRCVSAAYACFAEHAGVKTVLIVLLMVAAIATILIFHIGIQKDQTEEGKETAVKFSSNETTINIPSLVPGVPQDTSNTLVEPSQTLSDEVHFIPGQETSTGVATGVPFQPGHKPSSPVVAAVAENEAPNPNLNTEFKVATWVSMISSGAIVSVVSGLVGNEKATLTHKILFKAFSTLNYISLVLGVGVLVLILTRPNIPGFVKITKSVMWVSIGSTTYALGCATCLLLSKLVEVVLVLVVPLVIVCLIAALSFGCRNWIPRSVTIQSVHSVV